MEKQKVSVILCTYSEERYIDTIETIESLINQSYSNIEIILVIDRNKKLYSMFKSSEYLQSLSSIQFGFSTLGGLSNARNKGVELALGEIIAFIDDDAIADIHWIMNLLKHYDEPNVIGVGGPMKPLWLFGTASWIPEEFYWTIGCSYKGQKEELSNVRSNFGSNMSFRHNVFSEVGFFDENLGLIDNTIRTGEETEFSIRALNLIQKSKILFTPDAIVYHKIYKYRKSLSFLLKRCYGYGHAIACIGTSKKNIDKQLESTESGFLNYIFRFSLPIRIINIFTFRDAKTNILNLILIFALTIAVGIGYIHTYFGKIFDNRCDF